MNAVIKGHQELYDRLENRLQLAHRNNEILPKEVNTVRSDESTLSLKLRERNRDLMRRVKRLEKANSALGSRQRLEGMDPEALGSFADDITRAKIRFADLRAGKQRKAEEAAAAAGLPAPPPLTVSSSTGKSVKTPSSKAKKSRSKKAATKTTLGYSSSDESVISVSSESDPESSSDSDSSAPEGPETLEEEDNELSELRPETQCLEDFLDDYLYAPASRDQPTKSSRTEKTSPKSKVKSLTVNKADVKSSPKGKKKVSPKSAAKKKSSAKAKKSTASKKKSKSSPKKSHSSKKYRELVKLTQRASDLLTPYVAPEFTTVSAQKYWVKLEQSFLPSPVPSDADIKCTTIAIEKFSKFMTDDHPWKKQCSKWPEHACLFDTTDFQLNSHITQRADYPERLCGVWRRLRGYGDQKSAVESFAIYERKYWVSPEAVKRFFSRMIARLRKITDTEERLRFKLVLEHLKKVWFEYNKERADRADNLRTYLPGRMWPWCIDPHSLLLIVALLDPTLPISTMDNLM
ncbi:hypothetical protein PHMEG_00019959 [Phytophthora megakarya]|uniref:Uncharacterized protein n=1 Tax=Phytophthora megakarya TaxID=4795 RepID=A0A225VR59_9STRA|nr:hypothetical protein PHMEG_00019959 [Phytophthora megakarya]